MASNFLKRAAAGGLLAVGALLAIPAVASADTLVYQGYSNGSYNYVNASTGVQIASATFLGATFETSCSKPEVQAQ